MKRLCIFISLLILSAVFSQEKAFRFMNFTEKDGLLDKFIYSISQDKKGKIWLGTQSGLYYFNGLNFKNLKSNKDIAGHQIANILQVTYVDQSGEIWLSSLNALQILNPETKKFRNFDYNKQNINTIVSSNISNFCDSGNGKMLIGTLENFWFLLDKNSGKSKQFIPKNSNVSVSSKKIVKIINTGNSWFYAISNDGIFKFNLNGDIYPIFNLENGKPNKNNFEDAYYDSKTNTIFLACGIDGIGKLDLKTEKITYQEVKEKKTNNADSRHFVNLITKKSDTEIWFSSGNLGIYNTATQKFRNFETQFKNDFSYKISNISKIFKDQEQNIWLTSYNGLALLSWQNNQIKNIPIFNHFAKFTVEPYGILKVGKEVFIANNTSNGLLWLNEKNEINLIEIPSIKGKFRTLNGIQYLTKTAKNEIYGTSDQQLFKIDVQRKKLIHIPLKIEGTIGRIENDNLGNLYISTPNKGIYIYNLITKNLQHFNIWDIDKNVKINTPNSFSPRFKDKSGNIWFGKTEGLYHYNPTTKKFQHLATQKAINNYARITQSHFFAEDKEGNIWISTIDNGIFKLDRNYNKLQNFNKQNSGLPSDFCGNMFFDKKGFLWVGTLSGLTKFDTKKNKTISVITMQNGLKESNTAVPVNFAEDGTAYINHYGELSVLDINNYKENQKIPKTFFQSIKILDHEIPNSKELKLNYHQNFITFEWFSDVINNYNQNSFAFQLEGVDKDFIETKTNTISYSNLKNGTYTFWVKSANNDGVWGNPTKIFLKISPPFWKSWWFFSIVCLLSLVGIYFFNQFKIKQIKERLKLKTQFNKDLAELEMKALRAQMNPHFIFNSLNSIQNYILKNDAEKASQYLTKFSRLIRLILDHSNQNYITLSSEIQLLKLYIEMEDMRFEHHFESKISVDENLNTETTLIPSMLIQPSVENAIWHGLLHKEKKGILKLTFKKTAENLLVVTIEDNGIGRKKAEELHSKTSLKSKSYGTKITKTRIETLNRTSLEPTLFEILDLYDENQNATGTKVIIKIPTQKLES